MSVSAEEVSGGTLLPLPEVVYRQLRGSILDGTLQPGRLLRQEAIARSLNVSRVPVREAMGRLEVDGLIVLRPRRGYAVAQLEQDDILEIFELRVVIEEHAAMVAARARTPEDVAEAEALVERMEQVARRRGDHIAEWARLNRDFHSKLVASGRRKRLSNMVDTLRDTVEAYVRTEMRLTGGVEHALVEHREMLEAFRAGDATGLAQLSRVHVEGTARRLLDGLRRRAVGS